jgi:hypothetical protein
VHHLHPATHFVYDVPAKRTQQQIWQGHVSALIVNWVHWAPQIVTYDAPPLMVTYHNTTSIVPICCPSRGCLHRHARRTITTL